MTRFNSLAMQENQLNIFNIISGIFIIILSVIVIISFNLDLSIIIILLAIGTLLIGASRVINAITDKKINNIGMITKISTGILALIISIIILIILTINLIMSLILVSNLFSVVILFIGISRILVGALTRNFTKNFRILSIIIGIFSILLSIIIIAFPLLGDHLLLLLISFVLLMNGFARIIQGIVSFK